MLGILRFLGDTSDAIRKDRFRAGKPALCSRFINGLIGGDNIFNFIGLIKK